MITIEIKKLSKLDELVAEQLGYKKIVYIENKYIDNICAWVSPEVYKKRGLFDIYKTPSFSSDLNYSSKIIEYLEIDNEIWIKININQFHSEVILTSIDMENNDDEIIISNNILMEGVGGINSIPILICVAFLQYKGIEVELNLKD